MGEGGQGSRFCSNSGFGNGDGDRDRDSDGGSRQAVSEKQMPNAMAKVWERLGTMKWGNAVAGSVAGLASVVALYPLDVVRTRFQVSDGLDRRLPKYGGVRDALSTILRKEGWKGLYAGMYPALLGTSLSWGLYFFFYTGAKGRYEREKAQELGPKFHLLSAAEAGVLTCILSNPIWLVKTRLQLQQPGSCAQPYSGFSDALRSIVKDEGFRGLYKGLGPGLILVSHGALQFMAYEEGKKAVVCLRAQGSENASPAKSSSLTSADYVVLGAASKFFATICTYPYLVIRSRLQLRPNEKGVAKYRSAIHTIQETVRYEGLRGFYKGFVPHVLRTMPASSITFLVYESIMKLL